MRVFIYCFLFFGLASINVSAQMAGTAIFLPGHWLEIGQDYNGAFGPDTIGTTLTGYYPHTGGGSNLAEVYDYGHDGWTVGTPEYMGDYTYPGSPFEGWEMQVNGLQSQAFYGSGFSGGTLTGANVSYVNAGGHLLGNWAGTCAGLTINQETRVDTNADAVVVTTVFHNTSGAPVPNVYYLRSCDPDNDESWPGGSFTTDNMVMYQNDVDHRVMVQATGTGYSFATLALATKDCRAVAFIYDSWPLWGSVDLATCWNQTYTTAQYTVGVADPGDIAIGLVYNLGTIAAGDSTVISYAYVFNGNNYGIDSAFPDPQMVVNGVIVDSIDTFKICDYPGITTIPVNMIHATDKNWTWSHWSWAPGTGLATTTGTTNFINVASLTSDTTTFTITGTDSALGMYSCANKTFKLVVVLCFGASCNNPCFGDTIKLRALGDSVGATFRWVGPSGFTSTMQNPFRYPATYADTGVYTLYRTLGGSLDSAKTHVFVHASPLLIETSNAPLCAGLVDTLHLSVTPDSLGETFYWTGPSGFTSTLEFPNINGFTIGDSGIYKVVATTIFGCKDSTTIDVGLAPIPPAPIINGVTVYCQGATPTPFIVTTGVPGSTVLWYPGATGGTGSTIQPTVNTSTPGNYTFYASQIIGSCEGPRDSITVTILQPIEPSFTYTLHLGCNLDTIFCTNTSLNASTYTWTFGDGGTSNDPNPMHIYIAQGIYNVTVTASNGYCALSSTQVINTIHPIQAIFTPTPDTLCAITQSTTLINTSIGGALTPYWSFGDGSFDSTNWSPVHTYNAGGVYVVTLKVTDSLHCQSTVQQNVYALQLNIQSWHDTTICLVSPIPLTNYVSINPPIVNDFTFAWTPSTGLDYSTNQIPLFFGIGTYSYLLTATETAYGCVATDVINITSVPPTPLTNVTGNDTIQFGQHVQLNADNVLYYYWTPNDGSLNNPNINNPIATPNQTTTYTVYGMDVNGCVDTATVVVVVDSATTEIIPSAFTPNGDGLNDVFRPVGLTYQHLVEFRIFNRWGQQIFYSNNIEHGWDGTYQGVPQDMGDYFYEVIIARPNYQENIVYTGTVTLLR